MEIVTLVVGIARDFGLATWAGYLLFSAGSMATIGYVICVPLFVGSLGSIACKIYELVPEGEGEVNPAKDEKHDSKPGAEAPAK